MRSLLFLVLAGLLTAAACAPKLIPAPVVTVPKFPEFTQPPVTLELASSPANESFDRACSFGYNRRVFESRRLRAK